MTLPVIARVVRCAVTGFGANTTPWANIFNYRVDDELPIADGIAAAQVDIEAFYEDNGGTPGTFGWSDFAVNDASVTSMRHTPLDGVTASTLFEVSMPGAGTSDALPPDVACCLSWHTAKRGPRYRGRTYWAGMSEALNDGTGRLLAASRTQMVTACSEFLTHMSANGTPLGVASYKFSTWEEINYVTIDLVFDRQHRRRV